MFSIQGKITEIARSVNKKLINELVKRSLHALRSTSRNSIQLKVGYEEILNINLIILKSFLGSCAIVSISFAIKEEKY